MFSKHFKEGHVEYECKYFVSGLEQIDLDLLYILVNKLTYVLQSLFGTSKKKYVTFSYLRQFSCLILKPVGNYLPNLFL